MTWQPCDLFQCVNAACKSKVLVLESSRAPYGEVATPRCICGYPLQRVDHGLEDPLRDWSF